MFVPKYGIIRPVVAMGIVIHIMWYGVTGPVGPVIKITLCCVCQQRAVTQLALPIIHYGSRK